MNPRHLFAVGLAIIFSPPAIALETGQSPVMGVGVVSCDNLHGQKDHIAAFSWTQGFIGGMNMAAGGFTGRFHNLAALSVEDEEAILQRYCEDHPKAYYFQAAEHLYDILPDVKESEPLAVAPK